MRFAVTAAQQTGDNYAAKLSDTIPTLEQNAYQRYLNDLELKRNALNVLSSDREAYLKNQFVQPDFSGITGITGNTGTTSEVGGSQSMYDQAKAALDSFSAKTAQTVTDPNRRYELIAAEIGKYMQAGALTEDQANALWSNYTGYSATGSVPTGFLKQMDAYAVENDQSTVNAEIDRMLSNGQISSEQAAVLKQRYGQQGMTYDQVSLAALGVGGYSNAVIAELVNNGYLNKTGGSFSVGPTAQTNGVISNLSSTAKQMEQQMIASGKYPVDLEQLYETLPGLREAVKAAELQNKQIPRVIADYVSSHGYEYYIGQNDKIQVRKNKGTEITFAQVSKKFVDSLFQ